MMSTTEREMINETKTFVNAQLVSLPFEHEKVTPVSKVSFLKKKGKEPDLEQAADRDKSHSI